jgi:hypothetical protein
VRPAGEHLGHRRGDRGVAILVQQAEHLRRHAPDVAAGLHPAGEELIDLGHCSAQPILPLPLLRAAFLFQQRLAVGGVLAVLAATPVAWMAGDFDLPIEEADGEVIGDERQSAAGVPGRDRVQVGVEVDEGGPVHRDRLDQVCGGGAGGQREESAPLLRQAVADGAAWDGGMGTRVGHLVDEGQELVVGLVNPSQRSAGQEALTQVPDGALHAALLVCLPDRAEAQRDAVVARQLEQFRMEANGGAVTLQHHRLRVVE